MRGRTRRLPPSDAAGPFPPARGNQVARPRAPERQLARARSRDDQPGGSQPQVSNPETGDLSRRPPEIACDPVIRLKGDSYPFQDRDLGRVLRPALTTEQASDRGKFSRPDGFRFQAPPNDSQKQIVPLQCRCCSRSTTPCSVPPVPFSGLQWVCLPRRRSAQTVAAGQRKG